MIFRLYFGTANTNCLYRWLENVAKFQFAPYKTPIVLSLKASGVEYHARSFSNIQIT